MSKKGLWDYKQKRYHIDTVLNEKLMDLITERIEKGGFTSYSEYVRTLIRQDLKKQGLLKEDDNGE